ncbi:MAG TPA: glycosyltransferase family 4 protein [Candidatus Acidoferrales bacterium]
MATFANEVLVLPKPKGPFRAFAVCHFTAAHSELKSRSFHMQCKPLADAGVAVLYASPAINAGRQRGMRFVRLPKLRGKLRTFLASPSLLRILLSLKAEVYHFQDPELLPLAFAMKVFFRKRIVFDCYEDFPSMAYTMRGVPAMLRPAVAKATRGVLGLAARCFDGVMTADALTLRGFGGGGKSKKLTFYNFPNPEFFPAPESAAKDFDIVYRGGLSERAGTWQLLDAIRWLAVRGKPVRALLIGYCDSPEIEAALRERIRLLGLSEAVELQGRIGHGEMAKALGRARIGVSPLQDIPKFRVNIPVKVFEYWACGLPVVATDLAPIRPFFKNVDGGLLCPPGDAKALAQSIAWLLEHPQSAARMGQKGRTAIETRFTHRDEVRKLLRFYSRIVTAH